MFTVATRSLLNPRYIINFPTKRHWRNNSKIEDIKSGLVALVQQVQRLLNDKSDRIFIRFIKHFFTIWCGFIVEATSDQFMHYRKLIVSAGTRKTNSWSDRTKSLSKRGYCCLRLSICCFKKSARLLSPNKVYPSLA
jgi:hypothetical protein